ncbi:MAG: hypothetical protein P4L86_27540, partial [Mycobacterium sp.]|nr:hypothetical protein [Mycobacterium sp.]
VIAEDDVLGRPDPTTGQLLSAGNLGTVNAFNELYGPIPLMAGSVAVSAGTATPVVKSTPTSFVDFTQTTATTNPMLPPATVRQAIQLPGLMAQVSNTVTTFAASGNPTVPTTGTKNPAYTTPQLATNYNFSGATTPNSASPPLWGPTAIVQNNPALNYYFVIGNLLPIIPKTNSTNPYPSPASPEFVSNGATACENQPPLITNAIPDQMMTLMDGDSATTRTLPEFDVFDSVWTTDISGLGLTPNNYLCNSNVKPSNDGTTAKNPTLVNNNTPSGGNIHTSPMLVYPLPQLVNTSGGGSTTGATKYYWLYLRRPANPFLATSDTPGTTPPAAGPGNNPMVVVDCMRFAYIEGTGKVTAIDQRGYQADTATTTGANSIYSTQRLQPFRGGHAVSATLASGTNPYGAVNGIIPAYGLSEQTAPPTALTTNPQSNFGYFGQTTDQDTNPIYETLGQPNAPGEAWDYFPFNDRDFMSVAELTLVPGCPPGLFTKQFVENAPLNFKPTTAPNITPPRTAPSSPNAGTALINNGTSVPAVPHVYPYLVDNFFYTAGSLINLNPVGNQGTATGNGPLWPKTGGPSGAGWHKMFEFF